MVHKGTFEIEGEVTEALPNTLFRVKIEKTPVEKLEGQIILCHLSGKMRMHYIKVLPGDKIKAEMTPYDLEKGRITINMVDGLI